MLNPLVKNALEKLDTDPKFKPITEPPFRAVKSIQFGILSPREIVDNSVCEINKTRTNGDPVGTLYDLVMGPSKDRQKCSTCNEEIAVCPGHFGYLTLTEPILHPMFIKFLVAILNCICLKCSELKLTSDEINLEINISEHDRYIRYIDKLKIIVEKCKNVPFCNNIGCRHVHPAIQENMGTIHIVHKIKNSKSDKKSTTVLDIVTLDTILSKVSDETLQTIGFNASFREIFKYGIVSESIRTFRPEWLIIRVLPILPPMARPPNNDGESRSDDDLTTSYSEIIKINEKLKDPTLLKPSKEKERADMVKLLYMYIAGLFDNTGGGIVRNGGKVAKGIKDRISSKKGIIRDKIMGKRVDVSARTVITADINLRVNQVGIPEQIAKTLTFPERVTKRNRGEIMNLFDQGKITSIFFKATHKLHHVNHLPATFTSKNIQYGDIAWRHLRDGDTVVFNRQPTLHRGSMMGHSVVVMKGKTFRLNLSTTKPYNADFDGDEMQLHVPQDYGTAMEVQQLMNVNKMIVSPQSSRPIMGVIQDALISLYLMTFTPNVEISPRQFMNAVHSAGVQYIRMLPSLFSRARKYYKNLYNGRVLFSILLPPDLNYKHTNNISKDEPTVIIENGILIKGIVDKSIVGQSHSSIVHRLYKEYSPDRAADFLSDSQFLANRWIGERGFSIGMADYLISKENTIGVQMAIQKAYVEVENIEQSNDFPQLKEMKINNALNNRGQNLAIDGLCENNRLEVMIKSGSKGSKMNIIQITGHLGQNNVEGKRIQPEIDDGRRTLPCFKRGNKHPRTRGFIENSFLRGLSPAEFFFHAKCGREGVINTAIKTKETGYAERKLVKRMEDLIIEQDQSVRNTVHNIISFNYGLCENPTMVYNNAGPSFIDIDNLINQLNAEPAEINEEICHAEHLKNLRKEIELELQQLNLNAKKLIGVQRKVCTDRIKRLENKLKILK